MTVALLDQGVEVVAGLFRFLCGPPATFESVAAECDRSGAICYCIDDEMVYEPFFGDFGPLNLGHTYNFCKRTNEFLEAARKAGTVVYFYCGPHPWRRANASVLVGIWQVLYLNRSAEQAYAPLAALPPCEEFRDASSGTSLLPLTILDVIQGMARAKAAGFVDWQRNPASFDAEAYLHYEQVQNGDLNWVVPGKLLAFAGPTAVAKHFWGYRTFTPEDYHQYFADTGVTAVVRLNNELYKPSAFTKGGFRHFDLFFVDGSCPSSDIVLRFLDIVESEPGGVAVHCKAGLGRTGVLICCYMMKHHGFTAKEAIAYIRICRPGSVIGPQQTFLHINEAELWKHGELYRQHQKEKEAAAMRKAADAVAVHALNRAVAKRSKASSGLVVDIVASATINAVHTWPMETDSPLEDDVSATDSNCSSATASPVRHSGRQAATQGLLPRNTGTGNRPSSGPSAGHKIGARIAAGAAALSEFLSGGTGQVPAASSQQPAAGAAAALPTTPARGARRSAASVGLTPPSSRRPSTPASSEDSRSGSPASNPPSVGSRFLAENGQPRKGIAAPSPNSKARRGLNFGGLEPVAGWSIGSVKQ